MYFVNALSLSRRFRNIALFFIATTVTLAALTLSAVGAPKKEAGLMFTKDGELLMPKNYRQWIFVGAPVTPNDMNNGKAAFPEFHNVYIDPTSFAAYSKTGKFPDGTILVKELASVGAKSAASGNGYFPGEFIGVAAAVKDSKRFAKEPGNWAYFKFIGADGKALAEAKMEPTENCNVCHQKSAAEDWVFTQFYPVLRAAKTTK
jgi:cytochrome P460